MPVNVAFGRPHVSLTTSIVGGAATAITLPSSGVLTFAANASVPGSAAASPFIQFPAPWPAVTSQPGVRLIIHNFSSVTPVLPTLLNADNSVFCNLFELVEPGGSVTSWGITNSVAPGLPTTALKLALQNLAAGDAAGFSVEVMAWAV